MRLEERRHASFTDAETEFVLETSDSPVTVDGYALGEPTGEVRCRECGAVARNVDEIPHAKDCDQRFVRSGWWVDHLIK
jgi:hypothetical protein